MPEEQTETIMAVDELQAIIERCVSTSLKSHKCKQCKFHFMASKHKTLVSRSPPCYLDSDSMFH